MNIDKIKDNMETRNEDYIDSESFRDNFEGTEEQLKTIAETVYELVDATSYPEDDAFLDKCDSMIQYDYDYLTKDQADTVYQMIIKIIDRGE